MNEPLADDWLLRIKCLIYVANQECVCHVWKTERTCIRCEILNDARKKWPTEHSDAIHAVFMSKGTTDGI
jgi:hypothetical protein